ncbi:MAG: carbohydrate-binding family 9-like protein [Saprospiraceae bacterium]|nr:carbohydrate-binding family 9-like protein [Saprospiraceae bacterium]
MKILTLCLGLYVLAGITNVRSNKEHIQTISNIKESQDTILPIPCDTSQIPHYTAIYTKDKIVLDGHLNEPIWQKVDQSPAFRDLIYGNATRYDTRAAVVWDADYLYVAYWVEEPNLQASLTQRDAPIYQDNDVELFIAGRDAYYEFEINTYGTIYEVFFIWEEAFKKSGYAALPEFDRNKELVRPFHGVGYKPHPRGPRIGYWNWDFPGLKSAVQFQGTLNDSSDIDQGWTVELALPWSGMAELARPDQRKLPPVDGDAWRMDFSRFNQQKSPPPAQDSGGWAWSPHGVWDSHVPECFTYVHFKR